MGRKRRRAVHFGLLAGVGVAVPAMAIAAEPPPPAEAAAETAPVIEGAAQASAAERMVYMPADFAQFAPRSGLEMLRQVPGFTIDDLAGGGNFNGGGDNNNEAVRGLGAASGNVLLNGERFTSKSDSITDQLARIGADDVVRIELVDGATLNLPGLSGRIANVIALSSGGVSGQFEWKGELRGRYGPSTPTGLAASITGSSGPLSYMLALENDPFKGGADGFNTVTYAGGRVENRTNAIRPVRQRPSVKTSARLDGSAGWVANISGSYLDETFDVLEPETWFPSPGAPMAIDLVRIDSPEESYEIGADFAFDLGPGRLTLIGLYSHEDDEFLTEQIVDLNDGTPATGTRFVKQGISSEKIIRAEYGWGMLGGDWQLSGEGAYNSLDSAANFATLDAGGNFVGAPFLPGTGTVDEDRYEMLLFHGRPLSGSLTFQITAGGEYSEILQTGSNALSRSFLRPKGSVGLAWVPKPGLDISLQLDREVGQLDFDDILGEVDIGDDNTNAGNNDLRPEQKWAAKLAIAKDFGAWGSATVTLFENRITDYVTIVPLPGGGESIGNIDAARERGVKLLGTLRLDQLGIAGAKFDIDATYQHSALTDAVTAETRGFDNYEPLNLLIKYRHDVPGTPLAFGGEYEYTDFDLYYRVAEVGLNYNRKNDAYLFIEHKDIFGLTALFGARNLLHGDVVLDRIITAGPRNVAPFLFSEDRRREVGTIYNFSVKGSF